MQGTREKELLKKGLEVFLKFGWKNRKEEKVNERTLDSKLWTPSMDEVAGKRFQRTKERDLW